MATGSQDFDWTLPASDYRDPALYERERQEIFARNWMLFTWSERLKNPGGGVSGIPGYNAGREILKDMKRKAA